MKFSPQRLLSLAILVGCCLPAGATTVVLSDGREIEAASVRRSAGLAEIELPSGAWLSLPEALIANWEALEPPRPVWHREAGVHAPLIAEAAATHRLPPELLAAVARVESAFNPRAVSPVGAQGLLQLMPATAERFGVDDAFDPAQNVAGGARYLDWLLDRYEDRLDLALAGYNAGERAVDRYDGIPPYRETRNYVTRVIQHARRYGLQTRPAAAP